MSPVYEKIRVRLLFLNVIIYIIILYTILLEFSS